MKKPKILHKVQGISLLIAIAVIWIPAIPYRHWITSGIIGINALLELFKYTPKKITPYFASI